MKEGSLFGFRSSRAGFTLIELLVVIAIIAILAVVVVLTLNPAQLLAQSRDSTRLSDLATMNSALNLYVTDQSGSASFSLGSPSSTYISVFDPAATSTTGDACQGLGMPTSTSYHCAASSSYRAINDTGWIPVNFNAISSGAPFSNLPVDPTNQTSSSLYYSYATNGNTFEVAANPESSKYVTLAASNTTMFDAGSHLALISSSLAAGTVAQANMKLSIASNTAFVDFGVTNSLTPYIGDKITITDSSGHQLVGWIKAAGTGETYGAELLPNTTFDNTGNVGTYGITIASVSGGQSGNCLQITVPSAWGTAYETFSATAGMLLQSSVYMKEGTETNTASVVLMDPNSIQIGTRPYALPSSWTQEVIYGTADITSSGYEQQYTTATAGDTMLFDTASTKQVLTPSATGVTIVSASGGSTYNWTSEASGFNLNDSNGYVYAIVL